MLRVRARKIFSTMRPCQRIPTNWINILNLAWPSAPTRVNQLTDMTGSSASTEKLYECVTVEEEHWIGGTPVERQREILRKTANLGHPQASSTEKMCVSVLFWKAHKRASEPVWHNNNDYVEKKNQKFFVFQLGGPCLPHCYSKSPATFFNLFTLVEFFLPLFVVVVHGHGKFIRNGEKVLFY